MVCGDGEETWSAALENMFLNGIILGGFAVAAAFAGHTMSWNAALFRMKHFSIWAVSSTSQSHCGGRYRDRFRKAGFRIVYGTRPIHTHNRQWTFAESPGAPYPLGACALAYSDGGLFDRTKNRRQAWTRDRVGGVVG